MAIVPRNTFAGAVQAGKVSPVFRTSRADPSQFGAQEAAALSRAGQLRSQTGTAAAAVAERFGQNVSQLGSQLIDRAVIEKKEDDTNAVKRGLIELKEGITKRTLGENGLFTFRGQSALNDVRPTMGDIDAINKKIREALPSEQSRIMYDFAAFLPINTITKEIGRFRINQRNAVTIDTAKATIKSANSAVAAAPGVPQNFQDQLIIVGTESATISKAQGHSKEAAAAFAVDNYSEIMKSAVTAAIKARRVDVAKAILDGTEKSGYKLPKGVTIDGNVRKDLEKLIADYKDKAAAQVFVDDMFVQGLDEREMLKKANTIDNVNLRDEVKSRVRRRQQDERDITSHEKVLAFDEVVNVIDQGKTTSDVDPKVWAALTPQQKQFARNYQTSKATVKSDPVTLVKLDDAISASVDKESLEKTRVKIQEAYVNGKLDKASYNALISRARKEQSPEETRKKAWYKMSTQLAKSRLGWQGGLISKFVDPLGAERYTQSLVELNEWIEANPDQEGRAIVDKMREIVEPYAVEMMQTITGDRSGTTPVGLPQATAAFDGKFKLQKSTGKVYTVRSKKRGKFIAWEWVEVEVIR